MPCFAECYLQKQFSKKSFTSNFTSLKNKWYGIVVTLTSKIYSLATVGQVHMATKDLIAVCFIRRDFQNPNPRYKTGSLYTKMQHRSLLDSFKYIVTVRFGLFKLK